MALAIKSKKGLDLRLRGTPAQVIETARPVRSVAVLGSDYAGLKPKLAVQAGDRVALGQTLFVDKRDPDVAYTAPGAGIVAAVNRGARRTLVSVVIELDDDAALHADVAGLGGGDPRRLDAAAIRAALARSGLWTAFRMRPFSRVPHSASRPRSIFVTAIDTQPLAPDPATIVAADRESFAAGLAVVQRLTDGPVYLCTAPGWDGPTGDAERVRHAEFHGPHPAGLVGTHIHRLDPVGADRTVWHVGYQDVIAFGKLFTERRLVVARTIALGGAGFARPRLIATRLGASVDDVTAGELVDGRATGRAPRLISGSVLNGHAAAGAEAWLGRYHLQIGAVPEGGGQRLLGWFGARCTPGPAWPGLPAPGARPATTALNGRRTASVPVEAFDRVMPLDILAAPLLRALLIRDAEQARALGCLELDAEDLALCTFVCPGKNDYGAELRASLEQIEREG